MSIRRMYDLMTKLHKAGAFSAETAIPHSRAMSFAVSVKYKHPANALYTLTRSGYINRTVNRSVWLSPMSIELLRTYGYSIPEAIKPPPPEIPAPPTEAQVEPSSAPEQQDLFAVSAVKKESTFVNLSVGGNSISCYIPIDVADKLFRMAIEAIHNSRPSSSE